MTTYDDDDDIPEELDGGSYGSPRWTQEILDCSMPMTLDTYSNCSFGCAYSAPADEPIMRSDLAYCRHDEVKVGDSLLGWKRTSHRRNRYAESIVISVFRHEAPIVEVTCADGSKTRCAEEHLWFTGRPQSGAEYAKAKVFGKGDKNRRCLIRHEIPVLTAMPETRDYMEGYLRGIYAGDGCLPKTRQTNSARLAMADAEALARVARYLLLMGFGHFDVRPFPVPSHCQRMQMIRIPQSNQAFQIITRDRGEPDSEEYRRGWLAGIFDAEGNTPGNGGEALRISQYPNVNPRIYAAIKSRMEDDGFHVAEEAHGVRLLGGMKEVARFQQRVRPAIRRKQNCLIGTAFNNTVRRSPIVDVRPCGRGEVVSIGTTTENYIQHGSLSHNCFSAFQRELGKSGEAYRAGRFSSVNVDKIERMFRDPDAHAGQFAWIIKQRRVVQWGGLSDAFDHAERKYRQSLRLLRLFREMKYPVSISTKGTWFLDDPEYAGLIKGADHLHWKISIITADPIVAASVEKGVSPPEQRFQTLERLKALGVGCTTLRFRPYIPFISSATQERLIDRAAKAGCFSVTTEFLCLEQRAQGFLAKEYDTLSKFAGTDILEFYSKQSPGQGGLLRLNYEYKRPHIERMAAQCAALGMKFFCSDAHHSEKGHSASCCGLPDDGPLGNWFKGHFKQALQIAKATGFVRFRDIEAEAKNLMGFNYTEAAGFNTGSTAARAKWAGKTMYDYVRAKWNDPKSRKSPAIYFGGVLIPHGIDIEGNVIYRYNAEQAGTAPSETAQTTTRRSGGF